MTNHKYVSIFKIVTCLCCSYIIRHIFLWQRHLYICFFVTDLLVTCDVAVRVTVPAPWFRQHWLLWHRLSSITTGRVRQHCAVPNVLDKARCLACRDPCTQTPAGEREHVKTGVCEACWDLLVAVDGRRRREAVTRCTRLASAEACKFVTTRISMNRVAPGGTLTCVEPLARHILAVGTGLENLPNLWHPGQRP